MGDQQWHDSRDMNGLQVLWPLKRMVALLVIVSVISGGLGAGMVYYGLSSQVTAAPSENQEANQANYTRMAALEQKMLLDSEKNTINVVEATLPGVVQINTKGTRSRNVSDLSWFFGGYGYSVPYDISGNGSGFVYDLQGHIVTNYHVIEDMSSIEVVLNTGKIYAAEVVGTDQFSDLAVLKIDAPADELKPLALADSDLVQVGQKAIAIGSPLASTDSSMGLNRSPTVTEGIVSATDRSMPITDDATNYSYTIEGLIQTDAAINPGNSGGPLLNSSGEVIGVNTAIISSAQGIGFAVPSTLVQKNVSDLIAGRAIGRPKMGITYSALDNLKSNLGDEYERLGLPVDQGALIAQVEQGGAADKAGLRGSSKTVNIDGYAFQVGGDIITAINGDVVTGDNFSALVRKYNPGDEVSLTVLRDGSEIEIKLTLGSQES